MSVSRVPPPSGLGEGQRHVRRIRGVVVRTLELPVRAQKGGSTSFKFTYTFDADDALAGKMSFMAMARIVGHFDALPGDNQFTSAVVKVTR